MIHSTMVDAAESSSLVHALQNKDRMLKHQKRLKKAADDQILVCTGPNTFVLRDKTEEEKVRERKAAAEDEGGERQKKKQGFGWEGALDGNSDSDSDSNSSSSEGPLKDNLLLGSADHKLVNKLTAKLHELQHQIRAEKHLVKHLRKARLAREEELIAEAVDRALRAHDAKQKAQDKATSKSMHKHVAGDVTAATNVLKVAARDKALARQVASSNARKKMLAAFKHAKAAASNDGLTKAQRAWRDVWLPELAAESRHEMLLHSKDEVVIKRAHSFKKLKHANNLTSRQRLQRDLVEVMQNRHFLPTIAAHPMEHNMWEWHCNMLGSAPYYAGMVFHCILRFPKNYPHSPPRVTLCTPINHNNVFGSYICLDMLEGKSGPEMYTGWTSGYTVLSVLMQLQSFLMDGARKPWTGWSATKYYPAHHGLYHQIVRFKCSCGHTHANPSPAFPEAAVVRRSSYTDARFLVQPTYEDETKLKRWSGTYLWTLRQGSDVHERRSCTLGVERQLHALLETDLLEKAKHQLIQKDIQAKTGSDNTYSSSCDNPYLIRQKAAPMIAKARMQMDAARKKGLKGVETWRRGQFMRLGAGGVWSELTVATADAWINSIRDQGQSDGDDDAHPESDSSDDTTEVQPTSISRMSANQGKGNRSKGKLGISVTVRLITAPSKSANATSSDTDSVQSQDSHGADAERVTVRITACDTTSISGQVVSEGTRHGSAVVVDPTGLFEAVVRKGKLVFVPCNLVDGAKVKVGRDLQLFVTHVRRGVVHCALHQTKKKDTHRNKYRRSRGGAGAGRPTRAQGPPQKLKVGQKLKGKVTRLTHFGAFVRVPGWRRDGLVHSSACLRGVYRADASAFVSEGQEVHCWVHSIDVASKKLGLGLFAPASGNVESSGASKKVAVPELTNAKDSGRLFSATVARYINNNQDVIMDIRCTDKDARITASANMLRTCGAPRPSSKNSFCWDIVEILPPGAVVDVRVLDANVKRKRFIVAPANAAVFAALAANDALANVENTDGGAKGKLNFFQRVPHKALTKVWSYLGADLKTWQGSSNVVRRDPASGAWYTLRQFVATYGPRRGGRKWVKAWRSTWYQTKQGLGTVLTPERVAGARRDCASFAASCSYMLHSCAMASKMHRLNTVCCFHTRKNHTMATLGFGLNLEFYPRVDGDFTPPRLAYAHTTSDIISFEAYEAHGLRQNLWKARFTHWFPAYIDDVHWHRGGRAAADDMLSRIFGLPVAEKKSAKTKVSPVFILKLVPKVLNTMVLSIMKGVSHASIAALHAYCQWAHILAGYCQEYPAVQAAIDEKIRSFITSERGRNKFHCPSLGEFLPLLLFSDRYTWADVAADYLSETFDRNSKWILAKHPDLNDTKAELTRSGTSSRGVSQARLGKSFLCSQTSMRLLCFHVALLRSFEFVRSGSMEVDAKVDRRFQLHPPRSAAAHQLPTARLKKYLDSTNGRTTPQLEDNLQKELFKIQAIGKLAGTRWAEVFIYLKLPAPSDAFLCSWLRCSMRNSGRRNYHQKQALASVLEAQKEVERQSNQRLRARMQKLDDGYDENDQYYDLVKDNRSSSWY